MYENNDFEWEMISGELDASNWVLLHIMFLIALYFLEAYLLEDY